MSASSPRTSSLFGTAPVNGRAARRLLRKKPAAEQTNAVDTARDMLVRHGLRAQAVAAEHIAEMRRQGDPTALHRWEQTHAAIGALRRAAAIRRRDED